MCMQDDVLNCSEVIWHLELWVHRVHLEQLTGFAVAAGSTNMQALVVMSKGTKFTQQSYKVSDSFPYEWIKKKWKESFSITAMATAGGVPWSILVQPRYTSFYHLPVVLLLP